MVVRCFVDTGSSLKETFSTLVCTLKIDGLLAWLKRKVSPCPHVTFQVVNSNVYLYNVYIYICIIICNINILCKTLIF